MAAATAVAAVIAATALLYTHLRSDSEATRRRFYFFLFFIFVCAFFVYVCVREVVRRRFLFVSFGNDVDRDCDANEPPFSEVVAALWRRMRMRCLSMAQPMQVCVCVCVTMTSSSNNVGWQKCCQTHFIIYAARVRRPPLPLLYLYPSVAVWVYL